MQTFRYTRRNRPDGTTDSYDSLSKQYPSRYSQLEYWTNGTVTHLMSSKEAAATPRTLELPRLHAGQNALPPVKSESNIVRNSLIAGTFAGIAGTVSVYPLDVLRTKMQSAAASVTVSQSGSKSRTLLAVQQRGTVQQVLLHTLQHGGIRALYTGMALPVTAQAVYKATVFAVNNVTTKALLEWKTQERLKVGNFTPPFLALADRFICGFVGGAVNALLFVTPVEFVRNQLIAQHTAKAHGITSSIASHSSVHYSGPRDVIRHTLVTKGIAGLWKGAGVTVARDSLGCGCFFYTFYYLKQRLPEEHYWSTALAGAVSGVAFWGAALPLDTVKTWVQNGTSSSANEAIAESISQHGFVCTATRLCRGWQVAFGRGMPAAAMTMMTYEHVSNYLQLHV